MPKDNEFGNILYMLILVLIVIFLLPIVTTISGSFQKHPGQIFGGNQVTATVISVVGTRGVPANTIVVQYTYSGEPHIGYVGVSATDSAKYGQTVCITVDSTGKYQSLVKESAC